MHDKAPMPEEDNTKGPYFFGGDGNFRPWNETSGWLTAFYPTTGKEKWKHHSAKRMIGGVVVSGGDLVFTGGVNGNPEAFDAKTGKILYAEEAS